MKVEGGAEMTPVKFCTKCGKPIEQDNSFCGNCGASTGAPTFALPNQPTVTIPLSTGPALDFEPEKPRTFRKVVLGVLFLVLAVGLLVVIVSHSTGPTNSGDGSIGDGASGATSALVIPEGESQFISIVSAAQSQSRQVQNDMQRGGVKATRDSALCRQMAFGVVSDWVGTVSKVDSNSDGKGVFYVNIAPDIGVKTWNNAISDIEDDTLIEPGSPVFNAASAMKPGQAIVFSGTFLRGSEGDCIKESSLTLQGKVESPDFIFRFSNIAPYSSSTVNRSSEMQAAPAGTSSADDSTTPTAVTQNASLTPNQAPVEASENQGTTQSETQAPPEKVEVPPDIATGMLISKVQPEYPPIAIAARVQGTVVLQATITKTGEVESLSIVSGPAMLTQAAVDAVRRWRYRPYLLNNEPVEVRTTINVIFTLGG